MPKMIRKKALARIFRKRYLQTDFRYVYYKNKNEQLPGGYSNQNIGLFRCIALSYCTFEQICAELITIYKEVFADITAIAILDCSKEEFQNAFVVSEGYETEDKLIFMIIRG